MLSAYRIVDLSDERGLFCGHILGQLGAEIVNVEPPGGHDRSPTWLAYTRGHRSVELDLATEEGKAALRSLVEGADAVIESADPGTWEAAGLGFDELSAINPALVWISMTAFGSHGPKAGYAATDLTIQAAAGTVDICGSPDRAPLRTAGVTAWAHAGAEAAGGAVIALTEAQRSGLGQRVEVSAQRAYNLAGFFTMQAEAVGHRRLHRDGGGFTIQGVNVPFVWKAADGYVSLTVALDPVNKSFLDRLLAFMKEEGFGTADITDRDWVKHLRLIRNGDAPTSDLQELVDSIAEFIESKSKGDLLAAALDRRLLLVPVSTLDDMLESPQMAHRGFWQDETMPDGTTARLPKHLVLGTKGVDEGPKLSPAVGADNDELLGTARERAHLEGVEPGDLPLAGLKVLDFMWVMAGPTSTGVLAQYGATVVRVENAARIDGVRLLTPYYGGKPGREKSAAFAAINAGKLSITLDPNNEQAREVIYDLVRWADVVTESFSPRAMRGWGLDYDSLKKIKPDLIMLSSCLFGQDGPYAYMAGYGTMGGAIGGLVQPTGWPDRPPIGPYGAYTDVCSPRITATTLVAAVDHRNRTGEGTYIDQSQIEASLHYMAPAILDHQINGTDWDRLGNADAGMSPHGIYPSAGEDEWVAVAVRNEQDWAALCGVLGRDDWTSSADLASMDARLARSSEIDEAISAWTAARTPQRAEAELQAVGVPSHAVAHAGSPPDPQLEHLQHTVVLPHEGQDDRVVERTRIELTRTPPDPHHVPALGQHTEQVLREILGYDDARVDELRLSGALGGEPERS